MKKVFLVAALSLGTMTAFAQEEKAVEAAVATEVQEEGAVVEEAVAVEAQEVKEEATVVEEAVAAEAQEAKEETAMEEVAATQDAFNEVTLEEVPAAITEALAKDHPGTTISKAHMNKASEYKLEVTKEDGTSISLYSDAEGNWIDM